MSDLKGDEELPNRVLVWSSKGLNNLIEQDYRRIKHRLRPMLGLKSFETAEIVISGAELAEKIEKQFKIGTEAFAAGFRRYPLVQGLRDQGARQGSVPLGVLQ